MLNSNKFENRLLFCCDKELIPFLRKKEVDYNILIMQNIVNDLKRNGVNHIASLTELARMLQSEVKPAKIGGTTDRLILVPIQKFMDFILPDL